MLVHFLVAVLVVVMVVLRGHALGMLLFQQGNAVRHGEGLRRVIPQRSQHPFQPSVAFAAGIEEQVSVLNGDHILRGGFIGMSVRPWRKQQRDLRRVPGDDPGKIVGGKDGGYQPKPGRFLRRFRPDRRKGKKQRNSAEKSSDPTNQWVSSLF